ncbi:unnamed protein product [Adineta steineri]|uniref:Uncharacterized protein n=1 Tax=Adineta steineri TaxID=433720 RepID=A0A819RN01_9BILA|nr:unnamed protein product [Adineta steineri]CAF4043344.1 unnamed protein product [Adineta steineri]
MARGKAMMKKTSEGKENENSCDPNINIIAVDTRNNLTEVVILQHMTNFQDLFNDVLQNPNNENDVIMLTNNAIVTTNNDNVISLNENIVSTNNTDLNTVNNDHIVATNIENEKREMLYSSFDIDYETLLSLKTENATSTARSVLRYLYPNPDMNFKLSNVNKNIVDAIIGKSILYLYFFF